MKIAGAFLANHVEIRENLGFISGAFPEWWNVTELPSRFPMAAAIVVSLDDADLGQEQIVEFSVLRPGGEDMELLARAQLIREKSDDYLPGTGPTEKIGLNFGFEFRDPGLHRFVAKAGEQEFSIPLTVKWLRQDKSEA